MGFTFEKFKRRAIHIYTDGACEPNPGNGGWGYVVLCGENHDQVFCTGLGGEIDTTNNRMEMMAVIMALEYFDSPQEILIFSDSTYVVNGLNSWIHTWKEKKDRWDNIKNQDLWQELWDLKHFHNLVMATWVKGHIGIEFNEMADRLAVEGMDMNVAMIVDNMELNQIYDYGT